MRGQDSRIDVYLTEFYSIIHLYNIIVLSNSNNRLEMNEIFLLKFVKNHARYALLCVFKNFKGSMPPDPPRFVSSFGTHIKQEHHKAKLQAMSDYRESKR